MLKKYLPFIALVAAVLLLLWVRNNQRGAPTRMPIEAQLPNERETTASGENDVEEALPFDRNFSRLKFTKHARCRMDCRHIDSLEIAEVILSGNLNIEKIRQDKKGITYPIEGYTRDKQHVRVVISPKTDALTVVTVIDLEEEWKCNCN